MKKKIKNIKNIRRTVCIMANELHKAGMTLSAAFKKAWQRVKESMTIRAAGTAFGNRQQKLAYIAQFHVEELHWLKTIQIYDLTVRLDKGFTRLKAESQQG